MHIVYYPNIQSDEISISGEEARHLLKVLRLTTGNQVWVTDGEGNLFDAEIETIRKEACQLRLLGKITGPPGRPQRLHLAVSLVKNPDRLEWFIEKATEIGIGAFTPLICERTEKSGFKEDRIRRIMVSALKQSQRTLLPRLNPLTKFRDLVSTHSAGDRYIAHYENENQPMLKDLYRPGPELLVIIGPEGDFSPEEVTYAKNEGCIPISLGNNRLRTETAALVACMTVNLLNIP